MTYYFCATAFPATFSGGPHHFELLWAAEHATVELEVQRSCEHPRVPLQERREQHLRVWQGAWRGGAAASCSIFCIQSWCPVHASARSPCLSVGQPTGARGRTWPRRGCEKP